MTAELQQPRDPELDEWKRTDGWYLQQIMHKEILENVKN